MIGRYNGPLPQLFRNRRVAGAIDPPSPRVGERADRLESWKEIAAYLRRDVRTVQRWERHERLPIHRLPSKVGGVYAVLDRSRPATSSRDANSPIMTVGAFVGAEGIVGMTEASATRRPRVPRTRSSASTTASRPVPIAQVPTGWR